MQALGSPGRAAGGVRARGTSKCRNSIEGDGGRGCRRRGPRIEPNPPRLLGEPEPDQLIRRSTIAGRERAADEERVATDHSTAEPMSAMRQQVAETIHDPEAKAMLIAVAQSWVALAEHAERNARIFGRESKVGARSPENAQPLPDAGNPESN
jgi:hypothetical protein